jgi:2-succinyl-6-hydroxy-2,4-cyclohexadiene-1-carboxylate synthase
VTSLDVDAGDGLTLHVERDGSGMPLLLLHGFTGSTATWDALRDALRDRFGLVAVDLPGHGRSSAPEDAARYRLTRTADDLARVLDALGVDRAAVLGYSMGGRTALQFALAHPDRVRALVLESASPGIADDEERELRIASDAELAAAIERDGVEAFVDRWERLPLWASQNTLPAGVRARLRSERLAQRATGLANSLRGAGAGVMPAVTERLGEIAAPTLLVAGALDDRYVALGRTMRERIRHARLEIVPAAGHAVHLERPEPFAGIVAEFLETVPMGRSPANLVS